RIDPNLVEPHRLMQLLPVLAGQIFPDPGLANSFSFKWLRQHVFDFFSETLDDRDPGRAAFAADQFVDHLSGRAWVLTEIGPGEFAFTHRTFLEFFFAKYLDEKHESIRELLADLTPRILRREWTTAAHLALQIKADRGILNANRCAEALMGLL